MGKMYLMTGLSGSGKTTWAKQFCEKHKGDIVYLGIDDFYKAYNGDERIHTHQFEVWINFFEEIHKHELAGNSVLIDTNAITSSDRRQFIDWFPGFSQHNLIAVSTPRYLRRQNNRGRYRVIPEDEMDKMEERAESIYDGTVYGLFDNVMTVFNNKNNFDYYNGMMSKGSIEDFEDVKGENNQ